MEINNESNNKSINMKKNLSAALLLTMLLGVAYAGPKQCIDYFFSGDSLCTTNNGRCSISMRPRYECVKGSGSPCVPYNPNAPYIYGTHQFGDCRPLGMGFKCYPRGEVTLKPWKPLC